jgi:hypothetical protein
MWICVIVVEGHTPNGESVDMRNRVLTCAESKLRDIHPTMTSVWICQIGVEQWRTRELDIVSNVLLGTVSV